MKNYPCCGKTPRLYFADDEGEEIDLNYARFNGDCDPDVESSCKAWLEENLDYIAYFCVIACPCGITLFNNRGATRAELEANALEIWDRRVIS